jgi:hypothetical protein
MDEITQFLTRLIAYGGGSAAVAYLMFRHLGQSWIENKFSQRLEQFKHQQALEIQRLRIEIDSTLSGVLKMQEKEFEVLPTAWDKLYDAFAELGSVATPFQEYPDLDRMSQDRLDEFLEKSELLQSEKTELRSYSQKTNKYIEVIFWHRLNRVIRSCNDFNSYIRRYGIFLPEPLKEKFNKISKELRMALIPMKMGGGSKNYREMHEAWTIVEKTIRPLFDEIEIDVGSRLGSHGVNKITKAL